MFKKLKTVTLRMIAGANVATIIIMLLIAYSDRLYPYSHPYMACSGLAFPIFLAINMLFLVLWVLIHFRYIWIPLLGFALCLPSIRTYLPLNPSSEEAPEGAIKVLTYNVHCFAHEKDKDDPSKMRFTVIDYIAKSGADIACLQEANIGGHCRDEIQKQLYPKFMYHDSLAMNKGNIIALYSRFPIVKKERIRYESDNNGSVAFWVKTGKDTVIVINNHFENCHLDTTERREYSTIIKGEMGRREAQTTSKLLLTRLAESAKARCKQVDSVAVFIESHRDESIILCGDFNDNPISYSRQKLATLLTDCYRETGNGLGLSYNKRAFPVRIDYIMCSSDWQPFKCKVDTKIATSDHYPVYCWLKKR